MSDPAAVELGASTGMCSWSLEIVSLELREVVVDSMVEKEEKASKETNNTR